ncbi:hypothetical protein [Streptomyces boninensis]|uniref:hypothetical protein n=1 Tax=Streptomyces boninensis TaxID=2039455 RepID=UPI003B220B37
MDATLLPAYLLLALAALLAAALLACDAYRCINRPTGRHRLPQRSRRPGRVLYVTYGVVR